MRKTISTVRRAKQIGSTVSSHHSGVISVAVHDDRILLTLGRPGGVMTVRLLAADQLLIEDGPVHTRSKSE